MDGTPKDYSSMYREDVTKPASRLHKSLDGAHILPRFREQTVDLRQVVAKLKNLSQDNRRAFAMDTLNEHYTSVFNKRRPECFKVYIQYFDEKDTFIVRTENNTLKAVRDKLPKKGNYRYFFKSQANTCEEIESNDTLVPIIEKDGLKQIHCQVFPIFERK